MYFSGGNNFKLVLEASIVLAFDASLRMDEYWPVIHPPQGMQCSYSSIRGCIIKLKLKIKVLLTLSVASIE